MKPTELKYRGLSDCAATCYTSIELSSPVELFNGSGAFLIGTAPLRNFMKFPTIAELSHFALEIIGLFQDEASAIP